MVLSPEPDLSVFIRTGGRGEGRGGGSGREGCTHRLSDSRSHRPGHKHLHTQTNAHTQPHAHIHVHPGTLIGTHANPKGMCTPMHTQKTPLPRGAPQLFLSHPHQTELLLLPTLPSLLLQKFSIRRQSPKAVTSPEASSPHQLRPSPLGHKTLPVLSAIWGRRKGRAVTNTEGQGVRTQEGEVLYTHYHYCCPILQKRKQRHRVDKQFAQGCTASTCHSWAQSGLHYTKWSKL